jgi:hypothetical protein
VKAESGKRKAESVEALVIGLFIVAVCVAVGLLALRGSAGSKVQGPKSKVNFVPACSDITPREGAAALDRKRTGPAAPHLSAIRAHPRHPRFNPVSERPAFA